MKLALYLWLVLCVYCIGLPSSLAGRFACPANFPCYCMPSEDVDVGSGKNVPAAFGLESTIAQKVHCATSDGSAFDLTLQQGGTLRVQCVNSPDWSDFLLGASLRIGNVSAFHYVDCELPGPKHTANVVAQLHGLHATVEVLRIDKLRGNLSRHDLDAFPRLNRLVLTGNNIGRVPDDLLYGLPELTKLEMRGTQIKLPASGFFRGSRSLASLELSQNDLHDLQPGAFDGLERLELLNMWSCNITNLHPRIFRGLTSLVSLDIKMNRLSGLAHDAFRDSPNLRIVNFGNNNFTELPVDLFAHNRALKVVKLMHNSRSANVTRLPDNWLAELPDLRVLSLERIGLRYVPENLIWGSGAIVELNMNRNYLATLPVDLLRDARLLHKLSLNFNDLRSLPDRAFAKLEKLVSLDLSRNRLSVVQEHLFDGLDALQELNLEENDLKYIEVDGLVSLRSLRVARFSRNRLDLRTDMYDLFGQLSPFYACKSLEELYLARNNVSEIFADWTVGHVHLRKLDLSYNSLDYLQTEDLQFVSNALQVDLTHNDVSAIDLARLEYIADEQQQQLQRNGSSPWREVTINLNDNPIYCDCQLYTLLRYTNGELKRAALDFVDLQLQHLTCDGPDYMKGARLLSLKAAELKCALDDNDDNDDDESTTTTSTSDVDDPCSENGSCDCWLRPADETLILDCADRNLSDAPATIFVGNAKNVEIDLSGNRLSAAPSLSMGNGYELVRSLNLAGNRIESVDDSLIAPNLKTLRLDGNNLSFIDGELLQRIASNSNVSQLSLHGNPWHCDCEALALLDFLQNSYQLVPERRNISCYATNATLVDLQPADLCPYPVRLIVVTSVLVGALALLLGASLALFFYYQRQIKIYLYSKNWCLWLIAEDELDKDKIWDAFVSYSHQDERFVIEELLTKLENGARPYKLCIHGRDWIPGDWIPNNIMRSVELSRRTIIVLSPHFVESEWGKLEFQAAHKKALSDKCARLIVVLYGDVDVARIADPDLRDYLRMNTYVKWGDPWFYQKLRYALPHKCLGGSKDLRAIRAIEDDCNVRVNVY